MNTSPDILVVDDNEQNRYVHVRYLERAGFHVREAASGAECLDLAPRMGLVVLDVRLPDMSGLDVCRRLRQNPVTAGIPVLQTSAAFTAINDRVLGLQQGADAYLCIPAEADELVATVRALLRARKAEVEAQRMATEWQLTFDAISDGICLLTDENVVARCNRAFSALLGHKGILVGRRLVDLFGLGNAPRLSALSHTAGGQLELKVGERFLNVRIDAVTGSPVHGGKVCIVSDITRVKATQDSLVAAEASLAAHATELESRVEARTRELHERNSELEAFTYSISHDLRAPLRTMHNFVQFLLEEAGPDLAPAHHDYLQRIGRAAQRMDILTVDMLHYSQLGRSELSLESISLQSLVERLVEERRERAEAATARFHIQPDMPMVLANEAGLTQALGNLLDNALKFTRPGVVTLVRCSAERVGDKVVVRIADNGIGIESRHFAKIFQPFERLNASQKIPGTGIGLAIVQRCVEKMGGVIDVSSRPGQGSTFSISLPLG